MVDVGYNINSKCGVIKNVMPISNTKTEHLCFTQVDGEEQYALKKENIEYVIPSEGSKNLLPPTMTYAEKFKEVFGFEPNKYATPCDVVNCNSKEKCQGCPYDNFNWDNPYVKADKEG